MLPPLDLPVGSPTCTQRAHVVDTLCRFCPRPYAISLEHNIYCDGGRPYRMLALQILRNVEMAPSLCTKHTTQSLLALPLSAFREGTPIGEMHDKIESDDLGYKSVLADGMRRVESLQTQAGLLQCPRCRSTNVTMEQRQTRSADEGMSVFATCRDCKRRWRM